jgi:hypothetical protein
VAGKCDDGARFAVEGNELHFEGRPSSL